jgi:catechol 2,3-dioxygenase-like lactoylglutathione lyase family enzyme
MSLKIRGVHHIVLTVSEVDRSTTFYEKVLGAKSDWGNERVRCIPCKTFLLCLQLPPKQALPEDRFDENRVGLDHIGFSVASRKQLEDLLVVLDDLGVETAGIEFDPDGKEEYVCFRDPDNIQVEFYVGDYEDGM